jgi:hypothetical protein
LKTLNIIFFIVFGCYTLAQNGSVAGKIIDGLTNKPLLFTSVFAEETTFGSVSDSTGNFIIENIPAGNFKLTAKLIGYKPKTLPVTVIKNEITKINFYLSPDVLSFNEIVVEDKRSVSASSSLVLSTIDFELREKESTQDLLKLVPGLIISQHAGGGKAEQIFIRGFDADHGTDLSISVDDVPVNMVSHAHGQGYADLHFIIPEVIKGIEVQKGPYFAGSGDFSTAGSLNFNTIDYLENELITVEGGSFGTLRTLTMINLPFNFSNTTSFAAAEFVRSDGYFNSPQNFKRFNLFGKVRSEISKYSHLTFTLSGFASAWNASGQIPERAVKDRTIDRYGSLDDSEGGETKRFNFNLSYNSWMDEETLIEAKIYFFNYNFNLFSNFTFYLNNTEDGDQIQQTDDRSVYGYKGTYSFANKINQIKFRTTLGTTLRADNIDVELWNTKRREKIYPKVLAEINQKNFSLFLKEEIYFNTFIRLELGIRGDLFLFNVKNRYKTGESGRKNQIVVSPKANLVISPSSELDLFFNAGGGFHSNDARVVISHSNQRTLPRAFGAEIGIKLRILSRIIFSSSFWLLDLENEFVYVGDEGITELSGPSSRKGIDTGIRAQLTSWLWADMDFNISKGKFKNEPDGRNYVPLAPDFTTTAGIISRFDNGLDLSLRFLFIDDRPANESYTVTANGTALFEFAAGYSVGLFNFSFAIENIFNVEWYEAQFDTESKLKNEAESVSELHYTPGTPRNFKINISYNF